MLILPVLKAGDILIAPSYLHPILRQKMTMNNKGCIGIRLYSLSTWIQRHMLLNAPSFSTILFQYKEVLKATSVHLSTYQEVASSPAFLEECYQFIQQMKMYNIQPSHLPDHSIADRELKTIINQLNAIQTKADFEKLALKEALQNRLTNVYIFDGFPSYGEQYIIKQLKEQGATLFSMPTYEPEKAFYHSVNQRQEIESCAQMIIHLGLQSEDIHITLANASNKPLLQQIFQRYNIPFTCLGITHSSIVTKRYVALLQYYLIPDIAHLLQCMDTDLFHIEHLSAFREYLSIFPTDITHPFHHLQQLPREGHVLDHKQLTKLQELEVKAEAVRFMLNSELEQIEHPDSFQALLITVDKLIVASLSTNTKEELDVLKQIQTIMSNVFPYIQVKEDIRYLLYLIENIQYTTSVHALEGVIVTDLKQVYPDRKHHFILGCTQKNYPAFEVKKGIFNEVYYEHLPYPSMEERYQYYLSQFDKVLKSSPYQYASYPLGSYEGKTLEAALEIEAFMEKPSQSYPLITNYIAKENPFVINEAIARSLYVKNGQIKGSVSAFERYVKCPFSYFLRYGLSLREPMKHGFSDSYMGTLSHFLLETFVETLGKEYTKATSSLIEEVLQKEIESIQYVFPSKHALMNHIAKRTQNSIQQTLLRLDEFEQHSSMQPSINEYAFTYEIPLEKDITLALRGFIDRIDKSQNFACILDYKSSAKSLSEGDVFAALQLQLLTYCIVVKKDMQKQILGAYYISLKNENIPFPAGKMTRRPVAHVVNDKEDMIEVMHKVHRLKGWTMQHDIAYIDDTGTHIAGHSQNKDGILKARKLYNYETIEKALVHMYQSVGGRIIEGNIACTPSEDACLFCAYHQICRFKGTYEVKKTLYEYDDTLYLKGEEDAEME